MIIDLLGMWKDSILKEQMALLPAKPIHYSETVAHSSFSLPDNVKVIFIQNKNNFKPVKFYADLQPVKLTGKEQIIVAQMHEKILNQEAPNNYDGDLLLISSVLYDTDKNLLYIEAKKTKYSVICCLEQHKFDKDSPILQQNLYGGGVNVPLITENDGYVGLLQSNKHNKDTFLTVAGFLQAKNTDTMLQSNQTSLIEQIAEEKLLKELLVDKKNQPRIDHQILNLSGIFFRKPVNGRGFVEFIVPVNLKCHHEGLAQVIKTNVAPHKKEHTGIFKLINLNPEDRQKKYDYWSQYIPGGSDIYPHIVSEASRSFNKKVYGDTTQQMMPYSRGKSFPVLFFQPKLKNELSAPISLENNDQVISQKKQIRR